MLTALIIGISGQDGSYLSELLLEKGYDVHGLVRRASTSNLSRIEHIQDRLTLHYGDLADTSSLVAAIEKSHPKEVYNLAAMSDVGISYKIPEYSADVTATGTIRILETLRTVGCPARFYQASSSEMFGKSPPPQSENTPFRPRSPYGCAKAFSYYATVNYRESYGMHASNGVLFNHESPRRGENFVTRKIAKAVARIFREEQDAVYLGNLAAHRDWGFAGDFVEAMWLMLQRPTPDDYVIATGKSHSVQEFAQKAFAYVGLDWKEYVRIDTNLFRPAEVDFLLGDSSKAKEKLGWEAKTTLDALVKMMVESEL